MSARPPLWLLPAGAAIGFFGSLCGVGGGLFAVPILHYLRGFELKRAVATSLVMVFATTASSTTTDTFQDAPDMRWRLAIPLAAGVLVGAQLGFRAIERIDTRSLKKIFAVVLLLAGLRIVTGVGAEPSAEIAAAFGPLDYVVAGVAGLLGGFVAPMLGVGGGLFMVPTLFLGVAGLGFASARACSLAAGVVGSFRGIALHDRAQRVDWPHGLTLAAGALVGAFAGVTALHRADLVAIARVSLGVLLMAVAVRFVLDLRRKSRKRSNALNSQARPE